MPDLAPPSVAVLGTHRIMSLPKPPMTNPIAKLVHDNGATTVGDDDDDERHMDEARERTPSITSTTSSTCSASSPKRASATVDMDGTLFVKMGGDTSWTKIHCQLVGATLFLYDSCRCDDLWTEAIDLVNHTLARVGPLAFSLAPRDNTATPPPPTSIVYLRATSDADAKSWLDALVDAPTLAKKQRLDDDILPFKLPSVPPARVLHLVLVRHGHYVNAHTKNAVDSDQVLSPIGRRQAALTGQHLQQLYATAPSRDALVLRHSDMERAVETATIIAACFPDTCDRVVTPLLREGWPGAPLPPHDSASDHAAAAAVEQASEDARLVRAFDQTFAVDDDDGGDAPHHVDHAFRMVVCHANVIRYFLCRAMGISAVGVWGHFEINHCGITRIAVTSGGACKILAVNECGHLPPSLRTSSEDHL
ncbi:Aste57867_15009 [Aphanomyces stellatus]|uniref:Serine/threonine-protein phosphatase PGAM5, mitochondrial n=1 Tax=Aphanomyces stellatus TaxID=120398 RepID=A0A485L2E8_9STRA|nr:hypothetical protein As57867_014953 [Aphanomyces stellatus]VFT91823.1 Aste57867_15009 [Aphanomyces stellatus]